MSSQLFMNIEQVLDVLFAELPDGVYATDRADDPDPDKRSNSSAELRAMSSMIADLYFNLLDIDLNKAITTIQVDGLASWERDLFAAVQDSMLPFQVRQQRLLAKIRSFGGINFPTINSVVHGILDPVGLPFQILAYSGQSNGTVHGGWLLGFSGLGLDTYLGIEDPLLGTGLGAGQTPLDCDLDYAAAGLTAQDLANIQATAYTYEVQIYGNADVNTLALLDEQLTELEPARSTHVITNNATPPPDASILDLGFPAGNTLIDSFDFGDGSHEATYDVWDFAI